MKKRMISLFLCAALLLGAVAHAANVYTMTYRPGTTDTVTNMPENDGGTGGEAYTVSSTVPQRAGYEFLGWELDHGALKYKVTYVVNEDQTYGTPVDSTVPNDPNGYIPNEYVHVEDQLTTTVGYAYNKAGEMVLGTWEWITWDKADFEITEDTTITGGWVFTPAPAKTYQYIVHYKLYEGSVANVKTVHSDTYGTVNALGDKVTIDAIAVKDLAKGTGNGIYRTYANPNKYRIRSSYEHVTETITHDNYEITIWYEPIQHAG